MSGYLFAGLFQEKGKALIEIRHDDEQIEHFTPDEAGALACREAFAGKLDFDVMGSSSLDFPEEYGVPDFDFGQWWAIVKDVAGQEAKRERGILLLNRILDWAEEQARERIDEPVGPLDEPREKLDEIAELRAILAE